MKKRIIFKLYYINQFFYLSRNFNLQKVGNIEWLYKYFNFKKITDSVDELVILNVEKEKKAPRLSHEFIINLKKLSEKTFIPLTIGGGINNLEKIKQCFSLGAEKILFNSSIINKNLIKNSVKRYGSQAIICSIDYKKIDNNLITYINNGQSKFLEIKKHINLAKKLKFGEIFLNNIDRDGTGFGINKEIYEYIDNKLPYVLGGGAAKYQHFVECFNQRYVSGISTGNLFNFIGDGLKNLRLNLVKSNVNLRKL